MILKGYFNCMKLKLNDEKTNLMVMGRPNKEEYMKNVQIKLEDEVIKPKPQMKILGWIMNTRTSMDSHLNMVISQVNHKLKKARSVAKYMNKKTRTIFSNSFLLSKFKYGMPLYIGETWALRQKIHTQIMNIARFCRGEYGFKISCAKICKEIGWSTPDQMILKSTAVFIHKCIYLDQPKQITKLFKVQRMRRNTNIFTKYYHKTGKFERNIIFQSYKLYNGLPEDMKSLNPKLFKSRLKQLTIKGD